MIRPCIVELLDHAYHMDRRVWVQFAVIRYLDTDFRRVLYHDEDATPEWLERLSMLSMDDTEEP